MTTQEITDRTALGQAFADAYAPDGLTLITSDEARGNSRPVTETEFRALAEIGRTKLAQRAAFYVPPTGLWYRWQSIKDHAYQATREPWGGATYSAHTGRPVDTTADLYAITIKPPAVPSVSIHPSAGVVTFSDAMDLARTRFARQLEIVGGHLGVFHDEDLDMIDIDPVLIVPTLTDVETIGAFTHAIGGAYHFASGDGFWPPHVAADLAADAPALINA